MPTATATTATTTKAQTRRRSTRLANSNKPAAATAATKVNDDDDNDSESINDNDVASNTTKNKRKRSESDGEEKCIAIASSSISGRADQRRKRKSKESISTTTGIASSSTIAIDSTHCSAPNDDVTKVKTAKKCAQRWNALLTARGNLKTLASSSSAHDPFDCSDLIIPPISELVNREVTRGIERWKDLATRVIINDDELAYDSDGEEVVMPFRNHEMLMDATSRGDKRQQRLLPFNFDYACKRKQPSSDGPPEDDEGGDGHHRPRVISLLDPTQTLDYEEELWKVFNSVKTSEELERLHALGTTKNNSDAADVDATAEGNDDSLGLDSIPHGCQHTLDVKNNLKEWFVKYSRIDAHSLGRLRIRDRHSNPVAGSAMEYPSSFPTTTNGMRAGGSNHAELMERGTDKSAVTLQTTIRFEILRHSQSLKRGSGPDSNRMEVELHGSQHTLLDLHCLLVECALNSNSADSCTTGSEDANNIRPGVFFIENNFYTCGEVGGRVGQAIMHWLNGKESESMQENSEAEEGPLPTNNAPISQRECILGLSPCKNMIPMSKIKLEDLPLRLGMRYFHMFVPSPTPLHLRPNKIWSVANESAVYVTGIHTRNVKNQSKETKVPIIIHDTWAPPQRNTCLGCNYSLASIVTVNDPLTDAAPPGLDVDANKVHLQGVPVCSSCYQALHYQPSNQREGENGGSQPLLELRPSHQPGLVFPIEDYQRMVTASSLDEVNKAIKF